MVRPDFGTCGAEFSNYSTTIYSQYLYNGTVHKIVNAARTTIITLEGCEKLCGTGTPAYYAWHDSANTITTWVLPIIGLIVQAPWESNQAWQTFLSLCRWMGSPIASLSYILWNIKVTGKCALMVDMASRFDEYPPEGSDFSLMRDSMYILCIMNQYSPKPALPPIEAERLLRLVLFSNMIQLNGSTEARDSLVARRTILARDLREGRKKGVIPVFISFLWFVFALALSVELAFGDIGGNATAHNLALGLLVGWLPVLIVASTVDRNLVSANAIRERLNELVEDVRCALLNPETLETYKQATKTDDEDFTWMRTLSDEDIFDGNFFIGFGGQGREHFHYGVAHPLLTGIESKFIAKYGRDWLRHGFAARLAIVVGSRNINGLKMFDPRMAWQVTGSLIIVCGSVFGAFILSWFTPTVGLGCRSGGYLVYICIALGLLLIEIVTWSLTHETTHTPDDILARVGTRLERHISRTEITRTGNMAVIKPRSRRTHAFFMWFKSTAFRDFVKNFILRPIEVVNTAWLIYIIFAQTLGAYQTCKCLSSNWARGHGGYVDFETYDYYAAHGVYYYWGSGTALSCFVLTCGLAYIVHEYCTQAHISTEHYGRAMAGLKQTRRFKKHTRYVREVPDAVLKFGKWLSWKISRGRTQRGRRSLIWTVECQQHVSLNVLGA